MPRRLILSATERDTLLALPESQDDLIRYYTFNDSDLSLIRQRRGDANRLGFAVQLCLLRYPGYALGTDSELPEPVILWVAKQVQAEPASWAKYGERDVTRREHAQELRTYLQLAPFGLSDFRALVRELTELAQQTDKGLLLAGQALESLRQKRRILPALSVIDRACSEAIARANRRVYRALVEPLTDSHRAKLDELLKLKAGSSITWLTWLRQAPLKPNSRHMLEHIERLKTFQLVDLPEGLGRHIHQNRLLKLAREGGQMTPKDLGKFEPQRRYATLAAVVLESTATVIDELVDLHDRILVKLFSGAKHKHQQQFQKQGKAINDKVRLYSRIGQALLEAKESGSDPYAAIEAVIPWDEFTESVSEAAGDHPGRPRPEILRNLRPVRAEERPALRRHLGQGLAAVPRLRRLPAAGREVRRTQARAGPAPGDQPEQRPVPGRAFAAAGRAVGHRHPPGQGQRAARCHPHRVRAENHPAGCGGAGSGAGADRPNQPVTAAHQDHRTADGRGRLDGLQPPLHPLEGRGRGQRQDVAAVRNPR